MKRCLDEAVVQAYLDGELSLDSAQAAAAHIAACDSCAQTLAAAEQESAFFAAAFGPDESLSVPSEVLRANLNAAVARLETGGEARRGSDRRGLSAIFAPLVGLFSFTPRRAAAFAGAFAVLAFAVVLFVALRDTRAPGGGGQAPQLAASEAPKAASSAESATQQRAAADSDKLGAEPNATPTPQGNEPQRFVAAAASSRRRPVPRKEAAMPAAAPAAAPAAEEELTLPGEKNYQQAIASLEQTIKLGGDAVLRPSVRADYERNLAVINKAIEQTRAVAARDPKDSDAVEFLMAAYRSKVELLTTVADQAQVATLGR